MFILKIIFTFENAIKLLNALSTFYLINAYYSFTKVYMHFFTYIILKFIQKLLIITLNILRRFLLGFIIQLNI